MSNNSRAGFATKFGAVLATAGSAVGLGNVWRFPYMTGHDGGAAFILVYIICVLMLGIPGMISEFIIGRHAGSNAARAYRRLASGKWWMLVGVMGAITSMIILGFYAVIAGWCLQYLYASLMGGITGDAAYVAEYFKEFTTDPFMPAVWTVAFIVLTHLVVV
ncbi:sodium-dependent transporter, partial [uncultured Prevotella sp.]